MTTAVLPQDNRRLQGATAFSFSVHGLLIGLYLFSHIAKPKNEVILQEVEFFDLKPAPVEEAALPQAQQPPRSFTDFFKMAARPLMPQEAPKEAPRPERTFQEPRMPEMQRLVGKTEPLDRAQNIKLDARMERPAAASSISEIAARRETSNAAPAEMAAPKDAINIEAVGRRAVAVAGPALKIDPGASGPARGGMRDFPTGPRTASSYSSASPAAAPAIAINEAAGPARRGGGMPGGGLPIGYNRGGSIQLSEKPVGRPQNSVIAAPAPSKPKPAAELAQAAGGKKGAMDISGPLAGRKVITLKMPSYPAWAREKNVEAEIAVRFFVDADGTVLTRMIIERSSGYKELDDLCLEALRQFVFAPLTGGATEEQWGIITFRFKLS